jgi:uncharacterized protein
MTQPVVFFEVRGKEGDKLQDFYASLFNWKYNAAGEEFGLVESGGNGIGGGVGAGEPLVTFYVEVANPAETLRHVEQLGGQTVMPPTPIVEEEDHSHTIAQFRDPAGNVIGLVSGH